MTPDERLDRRLANGLTDLAGTTAPSYLDDILQRSAREGQRPAWTFPGRWLPLERVPTRRLAGDPVRTRTMSMTVKVLIGAVLALVVGTTPFWFGAAGLLSPSPSPTPVPSATQAPIPVTPELAHRWLGDPADIPGWSTGSRLADLDLRTRGVATMDPWSHETEGKEGYISAATLTQDGRLSFRTIAGAGQPGCARDQLGSYTYSLSPDGQRLSISGGADDCVARQAYLVRDWVRSDCYDSGEFCLGPVSAGTYVSSIFGASDGTADGYWPHRGVMTYTVPDGWSNATDMGRSLGLTPRAVFAACEGTGGYQDCIADKELFWSNTGIWTLSDPVAVDPTDPCSLAPAPGVGHRAQDLVDWLGRRDGLITTAPQEVVVGDLQGIMIGVAVDPAVTDVCPDATRPGFPFLTDLDPPSFGNQFVVGTEFMAPTGRREWIVFLDVDAAHTVAIQVVDSEESGLDAFLQEALPIIATFQFSY